MKQLFYLVLKYIRRQKFRTTLTFLCILFAVFVFNLLCNTFIVMRGIGIADATQYNGDWEANLEYLLSKVEDKDAAIEKLKDNPAIERYLQWGYSNISGGVDSRRDENGYQAYMEYSINGGEMHKLTQLNQINVKGDPSVAGEGYSEIPIEKQIEGGIVLPKQFSNQGYAVGDTIMLTIRAAYAKFPDNQPAVQSELQKKIKEQTEHYAFQMEEYGEANEELPQYDFDDSPGNEMFRGNSWMQNSLLEYAYWKNLLDDLVTEDETYGNTVTYTGKILGISSYNSGIQIYADRKDCDIFAMLDNDFGKQHSMVYDSFHNESYNGLMTSRNDMFAVVTNQSMDFDDAMGEIYSDLGLPFDDKDQLLHPFEDNGLYNSDLLMLKFRGQDSITKWLTNGEMLIVIVILLGVSFVVWALMRFVIDNCFEISVQERSAQFATLRIMGASRRQIGLVVAYEALFYCLAAVPLGVFLAYLCRSAVFKALADYGFVCKETSFPIMTLIGSGLAVVAILISAYTSSMWAARAYNPLEASKKTHLKGNKKQSIWTKGLFGTDENKKQMKKAQSLSKPTGDLKKVKVSRLNRGQKSFLRNYTMRNIRRTRSRFLVSVISMSLGTMLFAFGLTLAAALIMEVKDRPFNEEDFDVWIKTTLDEGDAKAKPFTDYIMNNEKLTNTSMSISYHNTKYKMDELLATLKDTFANESNIGQQLDQIVVNEVIWKQEYQEITGISYSDLVSSGGCIIDENLCGSVQNWNHAGNNGPEPEYQGREASFDALTGKNAVCNIGTPDEPQYQDMPVRGILHRESDNFYTEVVIPLETVQSMALPEECLTPDLHIWVGCKLRANTDYPEVRDALQKLCQENRISSAEIDLYDNYAETTGMETLLKTILVIGAIALSAVWLTGIFTMLNTVNTSVLNRAEELSMLRMVGMSRKMMRRTVVMESSMYCVFSTVIGGTLGITFSLYVMIGESIFKSEPEKLFTLMGIVLVSVIAANYVISRIAALPGLHTLKRYMESGRMMQ